MNIDNFTYGELKQIASLFNQEKADILLQPQSSNLMSDIIGRYVIVRSRNEGINAGIVKVADETGVILKDVKRIWSHKPKDKKLSWYEGVAMSGLSDDSKASGFVNEKAIIEDYSITICTECAEKSIREHKANEQC